MNVLPLEESHRHYLVQKHAIEVDADGNETLVGLSWPESLVYLCMVGETERNRLPSDANSLSIFLQLHERHTALLPDSPWIIEALMALNGNQSIERFA